MTSPQQNGGFSVPTATDNTGATDVEMGLTVNPLGFVPDAVLSSDLTVTYTVEDFNNNQDECTVEFEIRGKKKPQLSM